MPKTARPVVGAVIQARLGSTRLPGKVLRPLAGKPMLEHIVERLRRCERVDKIVLATTTTDEDARLFDEARRLGIQAVGGSEDDVLDRFLHAARVCKLDIIVRICSDSPLIDWVYIDRMIERLTAENADHIIYDETTAHACEGFEVVSVDALQRVAETTEDRAAREHVTIFIRQNRDRFRALQEPVEPELHGDYRMSVDVQADYEFMQRIYQALYRPGEPVDLREAVRWLGEHPEVREMNRHVRQKPVAALTRRAVFLLGAAALGEERKQKLLALVTALAERHHIVLSLRAAASPEALDDFAARGFHVGSLLDSTGMFDHEGAARAVRQSTARVVVLDEAVSTPGLVEELAEGGLVVVPLDFSVDEIVDAVRDAYHM